MKNILVMSPYRYALENKVTDVKLRMLCDDIEDYHIDAVQALPDEVIDKLHGKTYDLVYVDDHYIDVELAEVRSHISGDIHKNIKIF